MRSNMEGILLVNKPKGPTSFQIVRTLRKTTGERKIGHAGTLDPAARGLLILLIGKATKHARFFERMKKRYIARIQLGIRTTTDDREGAIIEQQKTEALPKERVEKALEEFAGRIMQRPPQYSAVKHRGRRAYDLARQGESFQLKPREVFVYDLKLLYYRHPFIKIALRCSKGTYIRSIARDLGERLGTGAILHSLIRTRIGTFGIRESLNHSDFRDANAVARHLLPVSRARAAGNDGTQVNGSRYTERVTAS